MGTPKAFLRWGNTTFLGEVLAAVAENNLPPPVIVTNVDLAARIAEAAPGSPLVLNRAPDRGQFHSLLLGLARLEEEAEAAGALVLLVDHPGALAERVRMLLEEARRRPSEILVAAHRGAPGHPLRLPRAIWGELSRWEGPEGLRGFLAARGDARLVETGRKETLHDIDTPGDYEPLLRKQG